MTTANTPKEIEPQPVITNSITITDKDIVMGNTGIFEFSQSSKPSLLPEITTPHETLENSVHTSQKGKNIIKDTPNINSITPNNFNTFYQTLTNNNHQPTSSNKPISSDFNDASKIIILSDMET
ncbi:hypothetical protein C1645_839846 [Glomus cerebriforme]|uniref:Uncharacterized protein n=1 Tax=Glomus cerebriforme TaxID=658196 RepID=A0A397S769_9GLOM|nr:hypothetical protein C1645_839846 [Glomus cerebriforme]